MNLVFLLNNEKSWKTVLVESDRLLLINKRYSTPAEFMEGYNDEGLGRLLKEKKELLIYNISAVKHEENEPEKLTLTYSGKEITLEFANAMELEAVATFIAGAKKLSRQVETMSTFAAIKSPAIGLLVTGIIGWLVYTEAKTLEAGGTIDTSGRRALVKKMFAGIAELLGSTGALIAAGAVALLFAYFIFKKMKTPPNQVVYA
jgi:preprotein translocase subunit Sss1